MPRPSAAHYGAGNKQDKNMIEEEIKERKGGNRLSFLPVPL